MSNVIDEETRKKFREIRIEIDSLIDEGKTWVRKKSILESHRRFGQAEKLLETLQKFAQGDIQKRIISRLKEDLLILSNRIDDLLSKREAGKKEDGNIAIKCNWNDRKYIGVCSEDAYAYNQVAGGPWCSSPGCKCREFQGIPSINNHPCYESIALKELYFGAGWDHTGGINKPRTLRHVSEGRTAVLTTRLPWSDERDRIIIGCLFIDRVLDDPGQETEIYGDRLKSIIIDFDKYRFKFWDYYKNPNAPDVIFWGSGLVRYITDESALNILRSIGEKYRNDGLDVNTIVNLVKYYEEIVSRKEAHL